MLNEWNDLGLFPHPDTFEMILHFGEYSISQLAAIAPEKPLDLHQLNSFNPAMRKGIKSTCGFSIIMLLTLLTYLATSSADSVGKGKLTRLGNCEIRQESKKNLIKLNLLFPDDAINQLNLNLCLSNWTHKASNYLHQMALCISAVSASTRYLSMIWSRHCFTKPRICIYYFIRKATGRKREQEERKKKFPRVFCTSSRHWVCRLRHSSAPRDMKNKTQFRLM